MSHQQALTAEQQKLNDLWEEHVRTEFSAHAPDEAIATMVTDPLVNQVPVLIGGNGRQEVYEFYLRYFLSQIPQDMEMIPVSRTISQDRVVDEMVLRFTHTIPMDWMLPGIPPTGKRVEIGLVVVVQFEGEKLAQEHLYWDQASVLTQLGLLDSSSLPVVGAEGARSLLDRNIPLNALIHRAKPTKSNPQFMRTAHHDATAAHTSRPLGDRTENDSGRADAQSPAKTEM